MKFYLDEDLAPAIAVALRKRGQGRCVVSGNARDFRSLGHDAVEQRRPHAGIVLCPPRIHGPDVGAGVKALVDVAERYPAGLGEYDVLYL